MLITLKFIILFVLGRVFGLRGGQNTLFSFALAQGGEFAFVLIAFGSQSNVVSAEVAGLLLIIVALSMALTPLLLLIHQKLIQPLVEKSENIREHDEIEIGLDDIGDAENRGINDAA